LVGNRTGGSAAARGTGASVVLLGFVTGDDEGDVVLGVVVVTGLGLGRAAGSLDVAVGKAEVLRLALLVGGELAPLVGGELAPHPVSTRARGTAMTMAPETRVLARALAVAVVGRRIGRSLPSGLRTQRVCHGDRLALTSL
jgi:hypothetical protein